MGKMFVAGSALVALLVSVVGAKADASYPYLCINGYYYVQDGNSIHEYQPPTKC